MMFKSKTRLYQKKAPSKDARLIIIYCEGKKREEQYFRYFTKISNQIRLEIEAPEHHGDTSPMGLFNKAEKQLNHINPKYEIIPNDEVWFVIDTDNWGKKITELRNNCKEKAQWHIAQSNPCFEVWLYYHFFDHLDSITQNYNSKQWKSYLHNKIEGGFNSKKHPILIETAIKNAKNQFKIENNEIKAGCTEVFKLSENIYSFVSGEIKLVIENE